MDECVAFLQSVPHQLPRPLIRVYTSCFAQCLNGKGVGTGLPLEHWTGSGSAREIITWKEVIKACTKGPLRRHPIITAQHLRSVLAVSEASAHLLIADVASTPPGDDYYGSNTRGSKPMPDALRTALERLYPHLFPAGSAPKGGNDGLAEPMQGYSLRADGDEEEDEEEDEDEAEHPSVLRRFKRAAGIGKKQQKKKRRATSVLGNVGHGGYPGAGNTTSVVVGGRGGVAAEGSAGATAILANPLNAVGSSGETVQQQPVGAPGYSSVRSVLSPPPSSGMAATVAAMHAFPPKPTGGGQGVVQQQQQQSYPPAPVAETAAVLTPVAVVAPLPASSSSGWDGGGGGGSGLTAVYHGAAADEVRAQQEQLRADEAQAAAEEAEAIAQGVVGPDGDLEEHWSDG
jgi:hypothetical protein